MVIRIQADGSVLLIHQTEAVQKIADALLGTVQTKRASHVEPVSSPGKNRLPAWQVDLGPVQGPTCLTEPFPTREAALEAERVWLEKNILSPALSASS